MSEQIHEGIEAFRRGGIEAVLPTLSEDVFWEEDPNWPDSETCRGREAVRELFAHRVDTTTFVPEVEEIVQGDGRALALMRWVAEGHGSGAVTELRTAVLYEFDGELASHVRFYLDQEHARQVFGGL